MLTIKDNFTKRLVLEDMFMRMEAGDIDALRDAGMSPQLLDTLRNLSTRDLNNLARMGDVEVTINVNCTAITSAMKRLQAIKRSRELQEYFIVHGANPSMLASLFKLSLGTVRDMRAMLCSKGHFAGRPAVPSIGEREHIYKVWREIEKIEDDIRERYYLLHQKLPQYSLACLWQTVNEFTEVGASMYKQAARSKQAGVYAI